MVCSRCVCGVWGEGVTGSEVGEEGSGVLGGTAAASSRTKLRMSTGRNLDILYLYFVDFPAMACSPFVFFNLLFFLPPIVSATHLSLPTASALDWLYSSRLFIFTLVYIAA